jgi:nucleotide-binding universal stress UspA family protein
MRQNISSETEEGRRMVKRILVSLDGTTFSEHALPWAVSIAQRSGAAINLATVEVPPPMAFPDVNFLEPLSDAELAYLDAMAERVRAAGVGEVSVNVLTGNAPEALEIHRQEVGADLTIMATHGRGPLARSWLGSVADHFVRSTAAPVLMVRPEEGENDVDLGRLPSIGKIVLTLDGSALSESAIEPTMSIARMYDAATTLVRVVEYPNRTESVYLPDAIDAIEERLEESRKATEDELHRVATQLREDGGGQVDQETRVVIHAAEGILQIAAERGADLIAMASHGRGGVRRVVLGSVTDKVLRGSSRPVLIVRAEA